MDHCSNPKLTLFYFTFQITLCCFRRMRPALPKWGGKVVVAVVAAAAVAVAVVTAAVAAAVAEQ
jgi:hypothetical protein